MSRIELWTVDSAAAYLKRRGRDSYLISSDTFVLGTTQAGATNTGAGLIRPFPTDVIDGDTTATNGVLIKDKIINGKAQISGTGAYENCWLRGDPAGSVGDQRPILRTDLATGSFSSLPVGAHRDGLGTANVRWCTIQPQTPSSWQSGIGAKNYYSYRNKILDCTDGFAAFSTTSDGLCNVRSEGDYVGPLVQFRPDPANGNRASTHNDSCQCQGNLGGYSDIYFYGTTFDARYNPTLGTKPDSSPHDQINGFTITINTQAKVTAWVDHCIFYSGVQSFNGGTTGNTAGKIKVTNCGFQRPGTGTEPPSRSLVINANMAERITSGNYYLDDLSSTVPVGNS